MYKGSHELSKTIPLWHENNKCCKQFSILCVVQLLLCKSLQFCHNHCPGRPSCTVKFGLPTPLVMMTFVLQVGRRPLYIASFNGHLDVVKTLLEAGANIHQTNKVGRTIHYNTSTCKRRGCSCTPSWFHIWMCDIPVGASSGYITVQGKLHVVRILEKQGLHVHVDMYYRVIPSQIIMLYATISSHVEHFCYELV